ncbi:hypothetical protein GIB67_037821 [Kingdonia uniflora]|uniref:Copine C-terminal domain-containing protein n=1 Tax=Kingdonia uniflora TaxID=39325 RepID=A0A7J7NA67_9MAGN|nr:hypothetical protein GIB67_037821 [Kingdonia uniflora]
MGGKPSKKHAHSHTSFSQGTPASSPYPARHVQPDIRTGSRAKYSRIDDDFVSLDQVTFALSQAGLESSNLIVGIDFTKSNEWTGAKSFNNRSLHHIGISANPYEQAITIIGRTLSAFDEDNLIPCYGFGDASTHDKDVFSFYQHDRPCSGFEEALVRYKELVPQLRLAENSGGQYHVLLIVADGQVTRSVDTDYGRLSPQEQGTIDAIVKASEYPLSIVVVGVGDGPWDMMREFDDNIPSRAFDNFQFVNFTEIMSKNIPAPNKEAAFALAALMEIPSQYKATLELQLLGRPRGTSWKSCLPPPTTNTNFTNFSPKDLPNSYKQSVAPAPASASAPSEDLLDENQGCPLCFFSLKDLAFGCGHQVEIYVVSSK